MATFNFVPRAHNEGNIGALNRAWLGGYFSRLVCFDFSDGLRVVPLTDLIDMMEKIVTLFEKVGFIVGDGAGGFSTPEEISFDPVSKLFYLGKPDHPVEAHIFGDQSVTTDAALWVHQKGVGIGIHIRCASDTVCALGIDSADGSRSPVHLGGSGFARFAQGGGYVTIRCNNDTSPLSVGELESFPNNAAAVAGGLTAGAFYRSGGDPDLVCVVH
jgi:hypothetical protein